MDILNSPFGNSGWYPNDKDQLNETILTLLNNTPRNTSKHVNAIICPHAGYTYCGHICASAFKPTKSQSYDHIIIIGPSHYFNLDHHYAIPNSTQFSTELGSVNTSTSFLNTLDSTYRIQNDEVFQNEHSIWMILPFVQTLHPKAKISPIIVGKLNKQSTKTLSNHIKNHQNEKTLIVISSDFTHYGTSFNYTPFTDDIPNNITKVDKAAYEFIKNKDANGFWEWFHQKTTTICGRYAITVLLQCLDSESVISNNYSQSGEISNDWSHSVSYQSVVFGKD